MPYSVRVLLLTAMLVTTTVLYAAPPKKDQRLEVQGDVVMVVKSLPCKVIAPEGADLYFWSHPDSIKTTSIDNVLTITVAPKGTHKVRVQMVTINFIQDDKGKIKKEVSKETAEVEVVIGGIPDPDPPTPPTPTDPLVKALKTAYIQEVGTDKAKHLEALSALYRQAAKMDLSTTKTAGELYQKLTAASRSLLPAEALPVVRKVVGAELKSVLPSTSDSDLTSEHRQRLMSLFGRLGDALTEAGK